MQLVYLCPRARLQARGFLAGIAVDAMSAVRSCRGLPASKFGGLVEDLAWSSDEWRLRQRRPRKAVKKDHAGCGSSLDAGAAATGCCGHQCLPCGRWSCLPCGVGCHRDSPLEAVAMGFRAQVLPDLVGAGNGGTCGRRFPPWRCFVECRHPSIHHSRVKTQIRMMAAPLDVVPPLKHHILECYEPFLAMLRLQMGSMSSGTVGVLVLLVCFLRPASPTKLERPSGCRCVNMFLNLTVTVLLETNLLLTSYTNAIAEGCSFFCFSKY